MMDAKIDGVPFGEIMNQAVKLKTHQAKPDRCVWDSWPKFKQNTMFGREDVQAARLLPFAERLEAAYGMKREADAFFRQHSLLEASLKYEYAISVFRYLLNEDPDWKKKGILDADIEEHDYEEEQAPFEHKKKSSSSSSSSAAGAVDSCRSSGDGSQKEPWRASLHAFYVACYLNLARVYFKSRDPTTALQACDFALEVDPPTNLDVESGHDDCGGGPPYYPPPPSGCDKALLLKAQVRMSRASAGAAEQEQAIQDVQLAYRVLQSKLEYLDAQSASSSSSSSSSEGGEATEKEEDDAAAAAEAVAAAAVAAAAERAELVKRSREVVRELKKLKAEVGKQKERDKDWGGVFERGKGLQAAEEMEQAKVRAEAEAVVKQEQELYDDQESDEDEDEEEEGGGNGEEEEHTKKVVYDLDEDDQTAKPVEKKTTNKKNKGKNKNKGKDKKKRAVKPEDVPVPKEVAQQLDSMEALRRKYEAEQRYDEADAVAKELETAKERIAGFRATRAAGTRNLPEVDFTAPTPEMVAEAAKQGIDLEDPMVLEALRRVQNEHKAKGQAMTGESVAASLEAEERERADTMRRDLLGMLRGMSAAELRDTCDAAGVPHDDVDARLADGDSSSNGSSGGGLCGGLFGGGGGGGGGGERSGRAAAVRRVLEERLVEALVVKAQNGEALSVDDDEEDGAKGKKRGKKRGRRERESEAQRRRREEAVSARTWRIAICVSGAFFLLRMWKMGYIGALGALLMGREAVWPGPGPQYSSRHSNSNSHGNSNSGSGSDGGAASSLQPWLQQHGEWGGEETEESAEFRDEF